MPQAIVTFHSIDDSNSVLSVNQGQFRDFLRVLRDDGAEIVDPPSLLALADDRPAAALTFDDGYANFLTGAFPALAETGTPATVFVLAGLCGRRGDWDREPVDFGDRDLLSWSQVEELSRSGVRFGAHGLTHRSLQSLSADEVRAEILDSKHMIEDRTGVGVDCYAYPYGEVTPAAAAIVADHFRVGLTTRLAYLDNDSVPETLPRLDAYYLRPRWVRRQLFRPTGRAYLAGRGILRELRATSRAGAR